MKTKSFWFGLTSGIVLSLFIFFVWQDMVRFYLSIPDSLSISSSGLMAVAVTVLLVLALTWAVSTPPTRVLNFWKDDEAENVPELHARLFPFLSRTPLSGQYPLTMTISEWMAKNLLNDDSSDQQFQAVLGGELGRPFSQVGKNRTEECMAAILFLFLSRFPNEAMAAAGQLAVLASKGSESPSAKDLIPAKYFGMFDKFMKYGQTRHAYASTMLISMLVLARGVAIFPMTVLGWMEQVDPLLWAGMNSVGRPAPLPDGLATLAHYAAEVAACRAIEEPMVDTAVTSIRLWLLAHPTKQHQDANDL